MTLQPNDDYNLTINLDDINQNIPYLDPHKTRMLVSVATNLSNNNEEIIQAFHNKLS